VSGCPFPQHFVAQGNSCVSHTCPATEDCPGALEEPGNAWPFYVVLIGPLTDEPVGYLGNVQRFCEAAGELMLAGYCPLNPASDLIECLVNPALGVEILQRRTREVLRLVAAAPEGRRAALCLGTENGAGTPSFGALRELEEAVELGIPIVTTLTELRNIRGSEP
jgi:hypothetical protein